MALLKVCTRSAVIPTRRRAGFDFTMSPQIVEVSGDVEASIRADDALMILDVNGPEGAKAEAAALAVAVRELESTLAQVTAQRDAALQLLNDNAIDYSAVFRAASDAPAADDDFGEQKIEQPKRSRRDR